MDALAYLDKEQLEQANQMGALFRNHAQVHAMTQGIKDLSFIDFVNPYGIVLARMEAKQLVSQRAAKTFLQLSTEGRIPEWVLEVVDLPLIRNAAQ